MPTTTPTGTERRTTAVRRVPVPVAEPPFDDEASPGRYDRAAPPREHSPRRAMQGSLALAYVLPGGVPAVPEPVAPLRLVDAVGREAPDGDDGRESVRAERENTAFLARQPTRSAELRPEAMGGPARPGHRRGPARTPSAAATDQVDRRAGLPPARTSAVRPARRRRASSAGPVDTDLPARRRRGRGQRGGRDAGSVPCTRHAARGPRRPLAVHGPGAHLTATGSDGGGWMRRRAAFASGDAVARVAVAALELLARAARAGRVAGDVAEVDL
jgi:hypothetical protein